MRDTDKPRTVRTDVLDLVKILLALGAIALVLQLIACQKQDATKIPEPDKELVQAMIDYCRVDQLPRDKWLEAQRAWGFQNGGNPKVMPMWNRAARDKNPIAIQVVRRAADLAVGPDKCPILDVLDHPERVPPKPAPNQPATEGSAGSAAP
jgi:hypothetical protein